MKTTTRAAILTVVAGLVIGALSVGAVYAVGATRPETVARTRAARPIDALSKLLGLTPWEVMAQHHNGKSLVEIAKTKGVSEAELVKVLVKAKKTRLGAAVRAGRLTQAQAGKILARFKSGVKARVRSTGGTGGCGGKEGAGGHGPGMMGGGGAGGHGPGMMGGGGAGGHGPGMMGGYPGT